MTLASYNLRKKWDKFRMQFSKRKMLTSYSCIYNYSNLFALRCYLYADRFKFLYFQFHSSQMFSAHTFKTSSQELLVD